MFFDFFYGNISKHNRDREINSQQFKGFIFLEVASQSISEGTDRVVKALALPHSSLPLVINTPLSNSGLYYGFYTFSSPSAYGVCPLPLTLITLDDWALATITGADSEKYMQGQVTADVSQMTENQHLLAAHCDAKGKMWSNLRLFRDGDGFAWIERRSVREPQLTELKKICGVL